MAAIFVSFLVGVANTGQKQHKEEWVYGSRWEDAVHARMQSTRAEDVRQQEYRWPFAFSQQSKSRGD